MATSDLPMTQTNDVSGSEISARQSSQFPERRAIHTRDELVGRIVGTYRLEERLGGGAMASVYRAIDIGTGELAALKLLLPGADPAMRERFRREVQTVSQLSFPNIVRTLAVSSQEKTSAATGELATAHPANNLAYIAMELVEGESLAQLLEQNGQLSMIDSCALLAPIARALAFAHERGVIHRDVKPSNILLRRSNWNDPNAVRIAAIDSPVVPLLSDFGIALVLDAPELTNAGRTIGTPAYMAPEQCAGSREIDSRADLYSIGAVLYRCLIGRTLFLGSTTQILHAHVYDPVSIPDDNMRLLSPLVVEILQLALAKDPQDRYANATELADDLAVAAGQRVRVMPRKSTNSEATATMTSLPASSPKTTTHILVPAPGQNPPRTTGDASAIAKSSIEELPEVDPIIPLVPPRPARTVVNRIPSKSQKSTLRKSTLQQSIGSWLDGRRIGGRIASSLMALIALLTVVGVYIMWPRSFAPPSSTGIDLANPTGATAEVAVIVASTTASPSPMIGGGSAKISETESSATQIDVSQNGIAPIATSATIAASANLFVSPSTAPITKTEAVSATISATSAPEVGVTNTATSGAAPTIIISTTASAETLTATATTTSTLDPALSLSAARTAFEEHQWATALENLVLLRQNNPAYSPDSVTQLLAESYLLLAARNNQSGAYTSTVDLLQKGQALLAGSTSEQPIRLLLAATDPLMRTENEGVRNQTLQGLQKVHLALASELADAAHPCEALEHVKAAKQAYVDDTVASVEMKVTQQCEAANKLRNTEGFLASLGGELLYSANTGSADSDSNIYRFSVSQGSTPQLLIRNGRYPMRQRAGSLIAYFNTLPEAPGIYGFDPAINSDPNDRGRRIPQQFVEDGSDAPSSWDYAGELLVFASRREPDRRSRLYLVETASGFPAGIQSRDLVRSAGNWPAWRPVPPGNSGAWVIFNGTNNDGNEPGLWLATNDGVLFSRLTDYEDDISPVWTPDGNNVFFANQSRSGNWDIYTVSVDGSAPSVDGSVPASPVRRITNSTAIDCMPAISPDGRALAFVSNRGQGWQIWILPIGANEPILLGNLEGSITDPAKQSMQWVK